jgi:site-specific DNA-cytosine methylase
MTSRGVAISLFSGAGGLDLGVEHAGTALRYFALDGTDHPTHHEQASMIRRYIIWRNNHAYDQRLRQVVTRANVA